MLQRQPSFQQVGAPDPELPNSPIAQEEDEDTDVVLQQLPGVPVCLFNGREFADGTYVASGTALLKCSYGVWIESGSADPRNP